MRGIRDHEEEEEEEEVKSESTLFHPLFGDSFRALLPLASAGWLDVTTM